MTIHSKHNNNPAIFSFLRSGRSWLMAILFASFAIALVPAAHADSTYTYTGQPFNILNGAYTCPPICSVSGSFTVASALGDNFSGLLSPTSFSFTDGSTQWTSGHSTPMGFFIATDQNGAISQWGIGLEENNNINDILGTSFAPFSGHIVPFDFSCSNGGFQTALAPLVGASCSFNGNDGDAFGNNLQGAWVGPTSTTATPEPGILALLASGLLGLAVTLRRKVVSVS